MARAPLKRLCAAPGCGNTFEVTHGKSHRYCIEHTHLHRNSHRKNPVKDAARQSIYKDRRWSICRRIVLQRDGYQCVICQATELEQPLVVDHIGGIDYKDPFNPDKCRTLCLYHSGKIDGSRASQRHNRGASS